MEGGSWLITVAYRSYRGQAAVPVGAANLIARDLAQHRDMPGSPFHYESFVVYQNRPFASDHVNVASDGVRRNTKHAEPYDAEARQIWIFGSSALFGVTNGDAETIPAAIEQELRSSGKKVQVVNFGVSGYTSWQDMLHFSIRLSERPKPDTVIFFNGVNDHYLLWANKRNDCVFLLKTGVGSGDILHDSWEMRSHGGFIAWPSVRDHLLSIFSNTVELARLIAKAGQIRSANASIGEWKERYRDRRDQLLSTVETCLPLAHDAYVRNMRMAATLALHLGIKVVFVQQPHLYETTKPLAKSEIDEMLTARHTVLALTDNELASLDAVPTYHLDQDFLWQRDRFASSYQAQRGKLKEMSSSLDAAFVELEDSINAAPTAIYSSPVHFTPEGARLVGKTIAAAILD